MEHPLRAKQRLAAVLLGEPLEQWVTARRPHTAWVTLASELYEALDGELSISHESLRLWYGPTEGRVNIRRLLAPYVGLAIAAGLFFALTAVGFAAAGTWLGVTLSAVLG